MLKYLLAVVFAFTFISCVSEEPEPPLSIEEELQESEKLEATNLTETEYTFKRNASVYNILIEAGHSPIEIAEIVKAAQPIFDLSKIQAGTKYKIYRTADNVLKKLSFRISNTERLILQQEPGRWKTELFKIPTTIQHVTYSGEVEDTLWESSERSGMVPYLITALTEVFAWEVDFSREIRKGDRWLFTVEQIYAEGEPVGWGDILHAHYGNGNNLHKAYFYRNEEKKIKGHFDENGNSMRRMFLKSPLKFGQVTSRFSRRRFHPIRKVYRPHLGVDYGAPRGTPVRSIGDGRIIQIGRRGGAGKMITIRHPGGYKTRYLHLSRYRKGMKRGKRVEQGQVIGYVGSTGLATGPHLHFEMFKNGRYKDPLKIKLPSSSAIPKGEKLAFKKHVEELEQVYGKKENIQL